MRKNLFIFLAAVMMVFSASAQSPASVVDKVLAALKGSNSVSASYAISSPQGTSKGTLVMSGKKFRVLANDVKCWYDGKTMWSYSTATGEVNISNPTPADLQMSNPYSAAQNFKSSFIASKGGTGNGTYIIRFTPKKKSNVKHMLVTVSTSTWLISKAVIVQTNGAKTTITISNYNKNANAPASTFKFDKKQVPAGTEIVDLR
ncbi:MAG: outer-membrane lipoprotein carrier protein LolA [Muribaculaceae bacterium]|nr:outer-membrane lipoprotein carrier protein LolA [Muribaculaceae bacterium]